MFGNSLFLRLKTEFLCQLTNFEDAENAFVVCATNCPWDLDFAFVRRFHRRLYVPLPNRQERLEFLNLYTKNTSLEATCQYWDMILDKTEGYSGSDLTNIVTSALNNPLYELENEKIWRVIDNECYTPVGDGLNYDNIVCCDITELPANSVKPREVEFLDLLQASDRVKRTISDRDLDKYKSYIDSFK